MSAAKFFAPSSEEGNHMSRIGKRPIDLPSGVTAALSGQTIEVKGPKGIRSFTATDDVDVKVEENVVRVLPRGPSKRSRQQWGMTRTQVANLVIGVSEGFKKELEITGVGYRAQIQGNVLKLALGHSHDVEYAIPEGVQIVCERPTAIAVSGIDQQQVGQVAAEIRDWRPPETYKGKGVRYKGEYIFRKEGKKK
jgi:large subunit ribosomal protein L6